MEAKKKKRASDRACRPPMESAGRPPVWRREHLQQFWAAIANVSPAVGYRWFRQNGGMSPLTTMPLSGRYLSFREREEIAILHAQEYCIGSAGNG